jgi:hypothetical protein
VFPLTRIDPGTSGARANQTPELSGVPASQAPRCRHPRANVGQVGRVALERGLKEHTPGKKELLAASQLEPNLDERVHRPRAYEGAPEQIEAGVGVRGVPTR